MAVTLLASCLLLASTGASTSTAEKIVRDPAYGFDALNRLRSIRHEDGSTSWVTRDLGGRAVAQTTTNLLGKLQATELLQNDGYRRLASIGGGNARRFIYGHSLDEMLFQESGVEQLSPIVSQLGSTQKVLNSSGAIAQQYKYDTFGAPIAGDAKVFSQLFAGAHYDNKAKLYDLRHRHYDPHIGRFLSRDPLGMHTDAANMGNAYAYVGNNPLNRRDPLGLMTDGDGAPIPKFNFKAARMNGLGLTSYVDLSTLAPAPIPSDSPLIDWGGVATRVGGGLRTAGGGVEAFVGGALVYAIGWTGVGAYIGLGIAGHGVDQMQAGVRTAWTGVYTQSVTEMGITKYNVEVAGLDRPTAETAAAGLDAFASMLATFGASSGTQAMRGGLALATASGKTLAFAGEVAIEAPAAVAAAQAGALLMTGKGNGPDKCPDPNDPLPRDVQHSVKRMIWAGEKAIGRFKADQKLGGKIIEELKDIIAEMREVGSSKLQEAEADLSSVMQVFLDNEISISRLTDAVGKLKAANNRGLLATALEDWNSYWIHATGKPWIDWK